MLRDLKRQILDLEGGGQKALDFQRRFNALVGGAEAGKNKDFYQRSKNICRKV